MLDYKRFKKCGWPKDKFDKLYSLNCFCHDEMYFWNHDLFKNMPFELTDSLRTEIENTKYSKMFFNEIMEKLETQLILPYKKILFERKLSRIEKDF